MTATITRRAAVALGLSAPLLAPQAFAADGQAVYKEFVLGNQKAKVTVIEYASLTCPHCAHFQAEEYPKLKKDYIDTGKIKFVYRDFPLDALAFGAALIARCVPNNKGHEMIEMMFKNQLEWVRSNDPLEVLRGYAGLSGLDSAGVDACVKNEALVKEMQAVQQSALAKYKVPGTPTFVVDEAVVTGIDYDTLKSDIEKALKK